MSYQWSQLSTHAMVIACPSLAHVRDAPGLAGIPREQTSHWQLFIACILGTYVLVSATAIDLFVPLLVDQALASQVPAAAQLRASPPVLRLAVVPRTSSAGGYVGAVSITSSLEVPPQVSHRLRVHPCSALMVGSKVAAAAKGLVIPPWTDAVHSITEFVSEARSAMHVRSLAVAQSHSVTSTVHGSHSSRQALSRSRLGDSSSQRC